MSCNMPMNAINIGERSNNKKIIKFLSKTTDHIDKDLFGDKLLQIPCGKCIGCRLDYSVQWANRCYLEANKNKHNYFITLTYNDQNLVEKKSINHHTGEVIRKNILVKEHIKQFMKKLRRHYEYHYRHIGIRFIASGEYGDNYGRPHYHLILFNLPINDLKTFQTNPESTYYLSEEIEKIWGKGNVLITDFSWNTAAYVGRYMVKKVKGHSKAHYKNAGITPEFLQMSRNPGIGEAYYLENKEEIWKHDRIPISQGGRTKYIKPPKYYDRKLDKEDPEKMAEIKAAREIEREEVDYKKKIATDLPEQMQRINKDRRQNKGLPALKRVLH